MMSLDAETISVFLVMTDVMALRNVKMDRMSLIVSKEENRSRYKKISHNYKINTTQISL